jgi:hypothetical protein
MISFALILMTLPSRVAEVRAGGADRCGLPESSLERGGCSSVHLDNISSAGDNASPDRTDRYNKGAIT